MKNLNPTFIVGIGGSAGALNAYKSLLDALPCNTGMAFVIIAHMSPTAESQLAQILSRHTKMKVIVATPSMAIQANHVYVIPPDADLSMENGDFKVVSPRKKRNNQIDWFLTSLAEAMGSRAIAIIFSGYDGDGAEGCKYIKAKGGTAFAQDISAEVESMPLHAQATGCVDFILPPDRISDALQKMVSTSRNKGKKSRTEA